MDTAETIALIIGSSIAMIIGGRAIMKKSPEKNERGEIIAPPSLDWLDIRMEPKSLSLSDAGLDLIKRFEGRRLSPYQDSAGYWTIGYGHLIQEGENLMRDITASEAESILRDDVARFVRCVRDAVTVEVTQSQFDALVSFAFNVGCGAFRDSTMLRLLNGGSYIEAANEFPRWNKAGGEILTGLARRRDAEQTLFMAA